MSVVVGGLYGKKKKDCRRKGTGFIFRRSSEVGQKEESWRRHKSANEAELRHDVAKPDQMPEKGRRGRNNLLACDSYRNHPRAIRKEIQKRKR